MTEKPEEKKENGEKAIEGGESRDSKVSNNEIGEQEADNEKEEKSGPKKENENQASKDNEKALEEKLKELERAVEDKQRQVDEYKNRWYRAQADFDNYRKRIQKEIQDINLYAGEQLLKDFLPVIDNFERALVSLEGKENSMYKGIELIYRQLRDIFEKHGVKEIQAQGKPFDPHFHEAVMQVESQDYEDDTVVEVLQKGYLYHTKVLRPSMVKVAKK